VTLPDQRVHGTTGEFDRALPACRGRALRPTLAFTVLRGGEGCVRKVQADCVIGVDGTPIRCLAADREKRARW